MNFFSVNNMLSLSFSFDTKVKFIISVIDSYLVLALKLLLKLYCLLWVEAYFLFADIIGYEWFYDFGCNRCCYYYCSHIHRRLEYISFFSHVETVEAWTLIIHYINFSSLYRSVDPTCTFHKSILTHNPPSLSKVCTDWYQGEVEN